MKMRAMRHGSLFSGIGGFDLAAEWMGWKNVFHCEINQFCKEVLKYYFPKSKGYEDIKTADFTGHRGKIDIITGGFPCQPFSVAGKRLGTNDDRHLWPDMLSAIRQVRPPWVLAENVRGLISWNSGLVFESVCADLEAEGYQVLPFLIPAAGVGAPHRRERIWIIAYAGRYDDYRPQPTGNGEKNAVESIDRKDNHPAGQSCRTTGDDSPMQEPGERPAPYPNHGKQSKQQKRSPENRSSPSEPRDSTGHSTSSGDFFGDITERIRNLAAGTSKIQEVHALFRSTGSHHNRKETDLPSSHTSLLNKQNGGTKPGELGEKNTGGEARRSKYVYIQDYWKEFPTQSPICSGNDGFSKELAGITFSKWRTESIKGLGNAIVPQVAYQIFKAIEAYYLGGFK